MLSLSEYKQINKLTPSHKQKLVAILSQHAQKFLRSNFNMDLKIPIVIDGRMTTNLGAFRGYHDRAFGPIDIRMNKQALLLNEHENNLAGILKTLEHECIHYACYMQGKPCNDGDQCFESLLAKFGVPSSEKTNNPISKVPMKVYVIQDVYGCYKDTKKVMELKRLHTPRPSYSERYTYDLRSYGNNYEGVTIKRIGYNFIKHNI